MLPHAVNNTQLVVVMHKDHGCDQYDIVEEVACTSVYTPSIYDVMLVHASREVLAFSFCSFNRSLRTRKQKDF